jgi:glycosyltransferase involved in cell wall biosynthesis
MKVSVVIPAFNEEKLIGACLASVRAAFAAAGGGAEHEVIVCDNNSSDATGALAAARGARVVFEPHNQIALARDRGAAAAAGEWLLFIDADSALSAETLREALGLMRSGRVAGGGALIAFDPAPPFWGRALTALVNRLCRLFSLAPGSFLFCRKEAFAAAGGFSPRLYAGEELALSRALRRWGLARGLGFAIITRAPHYSSGRKFRLYSSRELLTQVFLFLLRPSSSVKDPSRLGVFYEGRR